MRVNLGVTVGKEKKQTVLEFRQKKKKGHKQNNLVLRSFQPRQKKCHKYDSMIQTLLLGSICTDLTACLSE